MTDRKLLAEGLSELAGDFERLLDPARDDMYFIYDWEAPDWYGDVNNVYLYRNQPDGAPKWDRDEVRWRKGREQEARLVEISALLALAAKVMLE